MSAPLAYRDVSIEVDGDEFGLVVSQAQFVANPNVTDWNSLGGPRSVVGRTRWTFELTGAQDYHDADGLAMFLNEHDGENAVITIVWPNPEATYVAKAVGTVKCIPPNWGGTADEVAEFSVSLPVDGSPVFTREPWDSGASPWD